MPLIERHNSKVDSQSITDMEAELDQDQPVTAVCLAAGHRQSHIHERRPTQSNETANVRLPDG